MPTPTTWSNTEIIGFSGASLVDSLLSPNRWSNNTVSYSFPSDVSYWSANPYSGYGESSGFGEPWVGFSPLSNSDKFYTPLAFDAWSNIANIQFIEVVDNEFTVGDIRISYSEAVGLDDPNIVAYAYTLYNDPPAGDIWINPFHVMGGEEWSLGTYSYNALLHEIGHAIGLGHPFDGDFILDPTLDTVILTVMSYDVDPLDPNSDLSFWPTTPMTLDILAIQYIYGANYNFNSGDDIYFFDDSTTYHETIWDGGGNDSIVYDGVFNVTIDLNPSYSSRIGRDVQVLDYNLNPIGSIDNVWIAYDVVIENALGGAGNDELIGNDVANNLYGAEGNDVIDGGLGNDYLNGGNGVDIAIVSYLPSQYSFLGDELFGVEGSDTLEEIEYVGFGYNIGDAFAVNVNFSDLVDPDGAGEQSSVASNLLDTISDLYIAYFGRAPDSDGLSYWFKEIYTGNLSFDQTAQSFSDQAEYEANYPDGSTNRDFIEDIYANMFNRTPDVGGWAYWEAELNNGMPRDIFILAVINGAYAPTGGAQDSALLNNKHDVSMYYAEQSMLHPDEAFDDSIVELLNEVTSDANTASTAMDVIDFVFEDEITLTGVVNDAAIWDAYWA
ncbi:MAG TPA: DUF4214 domain-containing protein [Methylophilaceae bacterium]|nr:DUF4214 domain-containing protein [Methylophilaceae bacterium]